jgi:prepilin-type N-terminal cleavage/methylation domain-containing protein
MKRAISQAFTLIELLVVVAVSAVILSIVAIPMVQGFNLTRTSQAYADAQAAARVVRDMILSDLGNAAGIYFNPTPAGGLNLELPSPVGLMNFPGTKIDILKPAQGDPLRGPSGAFINPATGMEDPTYVAPEGQVNLPAAPGMTMVRYWIGLREPLADTDGNGELNNNPYNDPYSGLLMPRNVRRDNLFVLYRAEVQPLVYDPGLGQYVVNADFFDDADLDGQPDLDDSDFFRLATTDFTGGNLNAAGLQKVRRIQSWHRAGTIVTQVSRYDMVQAQQNPVTKQTWGDVRDGIVPLIRFQPVIVSNEAVKGERAVRIGEETDNPDKIGPDVYRTVRGHWFGGSVRVFPGVYTTPSGPAALSSGGSVRPPSMSSLPILEAVSENAGGDGVIYCVVTPGETPVAMFDSQLFTEWKAAGTPYPWTEAVRSADNNNTARGIPMARVDPFHVDEFVPFYVDAVRGEVVTSFDIRDVGSDPTGLYAAFQNRVPSDGADPGVDTGAADTPNSDPNISAPGTPWSAADTFRTINNRFNNVWARWNDFAPSLDRARFAKRFINLSQVNQPGGDASPLNRLNGMARAYVTPGSEAIYGPDQRPGPNYGNLVRYSRVASRPVGPNQYFMNYTDMPEPNWGAILGSGVSYDPKVFNPNDFVSAVLQPQYRAGYVELNSRFGEPLPTGNIYVSYRFQFTEPNDRVVVDYDTGDSVEVVLTIKNFPQSNVPFAQSVTMKGATKVRNFFR